MSVWMDGIPPQPSLLHTDQAQLLQPLLIRDMLQTPNPPCGPLCFPRKRHCCKSAQGFSVPSPELRQCSWSRKTPPGHHLSHTSPKALITTWNKLETSTPASQHPSAPPKADKSTKPKVLLSDGNTDTQTQLLHSSFTWSLQRQDKQIMQLFSFVHT